MMFTNENIKYFMNEKMEIGLSILVFQVFLKLKSG